MDGVKFDGKDDGGGPFGGVCDLVAWPWESLLCSGDMEGGDTCGIEFSNNSVRSRRENVRFASSAAFED